MPEPILPQLFINVSITSVTYDFQLLMLLRNFSAQSVQIAEINPTAAEVKIIILHYHSKYNITLVIWALFLDYENESNILVGC